MYSVLKCPACSKNNIICYWWDDESSFDDVDGDIVYNRIYPSEKNLPVGLPEKILNAYKAAEKIKTIDTNAYAVLLRRLLELICIDRDAQGENLA